MLSFQHVPCICFYTIQNTLRGYKSTNSDILKLLTFIIFLRPEFLYQVLTLPGGLTFNFDQFETNLGISKSTGVRGDVAPKHSRGGALDTQSSACISAKKFLVLLCTLSQNPPNSGS